MNERRPKRASQGYVLSYSRGRLLGDSLSRITRSLGCLMRGGPLTRLRPLSLSPLSVIFICILSVGLWSVRDAHCADTEPQTQAPTQAPAQAKLTRYALFWSAGSTWIIDTRSGVLFRAPTLLSSSADGAIFEYKLTTHSERVESAPLPGVSQGRPYGHLYRWVSLDRHLIGGAHSKTLTSHYDVSEISYEIHDEHQVLQFTGEYATLIRWFYHEVPGVARSRDVSIYTVDLARNHYIAELEFAPQLLKLTRSLYPQLIPRCLEASAHLVRWQLSGQRYQYWLPLIPKSNTDLSASAPPCSSELSALRISPAPALESKGPLSLRDETLYHLREPIYGGVVDALLDPNGRVAITLEGPKRRDDRLYVDQVNTLAERPARRYLTMWSAPQDPAQGRGRRFSFPDQTLVQRLDGARWIDEDHPLLRLIPTHFMPVGGSRCVNTLDVRGATRYRRADRPEPRGHLCAVTSVGRVWEGHEDLSVSIDAQVTRQTLTLDLWVSDDDHTRGDVVWLWLGDPKEPIEVKLTERGAVGREAIRAGLKLNWVPIVERRSHLIDPTPESAPGYFVHVELPLSLARGHLSVAVDDQDRATPSASQRLIVVGEPRAQILDEGRLPPKPLKFELP